MSYSYEQTERTKKQEKTQLSARKKWMAAVNELDKKIETIFKDMLSDNEQEEKYYSIIRTLNFTHRSENFKVEVLFFHQDWENPQVEFLLSEKKYFSEDNKGYYFKEIKTDSFSMEDVISILKNAKKYKTEIDLKAVFKK